MINTNLLSCWTLMMIMLYESLMLLVTMSYECEVYMYTGSNWDDTSYGPFDDGEYTFVNNDFSNDNIYSIKAISSSSRTCDITIFSGNGYNDDYWETFIVEPGQTRFINYNTNPDQNDYSNNGLGVWSSTNSRVSTMHVSAQYTPECEVYMYTGSNYDGTSYGPFDDGEFIYTTGDFPNDAIYSVKASAVHNRICSVVLFAGSRYSNDWEKFYINPGETRYFNYNSEPDEYDLSLATNYDVWSSTYSQISIIDVTPESDCDYSHTCKVAGDPHFTMFDGTRHHFQGNGYFDYVKVCDHQNGISLPFIISAKHGDCGRNPYLCIVEMIVTITDPDNDQTSFISFPSSGSPTFKDSGLSATGTYFFSDNSGYYSINNNNFEIVFDYNFKQAKLKFYYSGWTLELETSDCLSDNICGLCGYLSDDSIDDFTRCDNNEIVDNTNSNSYSGTGWTNTHIFGESCCNADLDEFYLDEESDCDNGDVTVPPEVDEDCLIKADLICRDAWDITCTLCDNGELTDDWADDCAADVCLDNTCSNGILYNNFDVNDVYDAGCLDTTINSCDVNCRIPTASPTLSPTKIPTMSPSPMPTSPTTAPIKATFLLPPEDVQHKEFSWIEANEYCQDNYGTTLATVSSTEELEELSILALNMRNLEDEDDAEGIKYWIGLSDINKDGIWHWTNGNENDWDLWNTESRFRYTNSGYCGQIRYRMLNSRSTGSSIDCNQGRYFVCNSS